MLRSLRLLLPLACFGAVVWFIVGCESTGGRSSRAGSWESRLGPVPVERKVPPVAMLQEVNLKQDMIKKGTVGRRIFRPMRRYR